MIAIKLCSIHLLNSRLYVILYYDKLVNDSII